MSAPWAWPARKTFRPMRPKPLIPTRTGMESVPSFESGQNEGRRAEACGPAELQGYSMTAADHLDAQPIGVQQVARVVALAVLRARRRWPIVTPTAVESGGIRRVDRRAPGGLERDVPVAR